MPYVIYNKETTVILRAPSRSVGCYVERYKTESAAKAALTRLTNKGKLPTQHVETATGFKSRQTIAADYAIAEVTNFHNNIEKSITRRNLMTGVEYEEPVNTPISCSPAYETYWSM